MYEAFKHRSEYLSQRLDVEFWVPAAGCSVGGGNLGQGNFPGDLNHRVLRASVPSADSVTPVWATAHVHPSYSAQFSAP